MDLVKFQQSETICYFMMLGNISIFEFSSSFQHFRSYTLLYLFSIHNIVGVKQCLEIGGKIDALLKASHIEINVMKRQKTLHLAEYLYPNFYNLSLFSSSSLNIDCATKIEEKESYKKRAVKSDSLLSKSKT